MKNKFLRIFVFTLAALAALSTFSAGAAYESAEKITVCGRGVVFAEADRASICFSVDTVSKKEPDAKRKNEKVVAAIKEKFAYVQEESYFSYGDPACGRYTVSRCFTIETDNVDSVCEITAELESLGASGVNCVRYFLSDASDYEKEALRLAIEDARGKAESISDGLSLAEITENGCFVGEGACGADGTVSVECNISSVYVKPTFLREEK